MSACRVFRSVVCACAALGVLGVARPALPKPKSPETKAARYERRGRKAYARKRWADAIASFEAAYEQVPKPKYLYNIGRSWERKGDLDRALD